MPSFILARFGAYIAYAAYSLAFAKGLKDHDVSILASFYLDKITYV